MENSEENPAYWRKRSAQAVAEADAIADPVLRFLMYGVAHGYELIAERIEETLRESQADRRAC